TRVVDLVRVSTVCRSDRFHPRCLCCRVGGRDSFSGDPQIMVAATITITGSFLNPDDTPDTGTITFTPINTRELSSDQQVVDQDPVQGLVVNGLLKNAAGTGPMILVANAGGYHVVEAMDGAAPVTYDIRGDIDVNLNAVTAGTTVSAAGLVVQTTIPISTATYTLTLADF